MKRIIISLILLACCIAFTVNDSSAIPAFARKYDMSCNVCHSPAPKLKAYGGEFAANGYQLTDNEPPRFTRETGDPMLYLMRELPLAIRIDGFARYQSNSDPEGDIEWPFIVKILSSGQIKKDISYFFYFLFDEQGEIAGVEDAFLHFNNLWGADFDVIVGQYQVADPIFKRELRPMFEDYEIYKVRHGMTKADLTYDRGVTLNYTFPTKTDLFVSILNGNGIGPANGGMFDSDPYKNLFVRVAQPIDSLLLLGTLGYIGKERMTGTINNISMIGGDATVTISNFELCGQYVYRHDSNPFFVAGKDSAIQSRGGFVQLMYSPELDNSTWYGFLLYNVINSDLEEVKYQSVAGNFTYLLARNFKVSAEYAYDLEQKKNRLMVGFMTAF